MDISQTLPTKPMAQRNKAISALMARPSSSLYIGVTVYAGA